MFGRKGVYWHLLPEQSQARKVVWNGIDREGRRIIDQFLPPEVRTRKSEQEMLIEAGGSLWQLTGSDNYDSLVGSNPVGVVFSEWALADPAAWDYIRPILAENGGWAMFIYTPRGMNHGAVTYENALTSLDWYAERLTVDDTSVITPEAIQAERDAGMSDNKVAQEFYCSFEADNEEQFIGRELVESAIGRDVSPWNRAMVWGVDVARYGGDRSALAKRRGNIFSEPVIWWQGNDTMETVGRVVREYNQTRDEDKPTSINVDVIGMGAGVVGLPVRGINVGERPTDQTGKYMRRGDELWDAALVWFRTLEVTMCRDELLLIELSNRLYKLESSGKLKIESKDDMKARGLKSPDIADAFILTFAGGEYAVAQRQHMAISEYNEFASNRRQQMAVME